MFLKSLSELFSAHFHFHKKMWRTRTSDSYIKFLRSRGIKIGEHCFLRDAWSTAIDLTRPTLIEIGNNVDMNHNFTIMTHDYATSVFIRTHSEFINSSGRVKIGNNIYFGKNCTVLKGVTIGDNVVIGAHSLVTRDIPSNSVAAGVPAKVVCTIDEYFKKRRNLCIEEALEFGRSIRERLGREPIAEDFTEEFPLFIDEARIDEYPRLPIKRQMDTAYEKWVINHKATFDNFDDFIKNL